MGEETAAAEVEIAAAQAEVDSLQSKEKQARREAGGEGAEAETAALAQQAPAPVEALGQLAAQLAEHSDREKAEELRTQCQAITNQWSAMAKSLEELTQQCKLLLTQPPAAAPGQSHKQPDENIAEPREDMEVDAQWTEEEKQILEAAMDDRKRPNEVQFEQAFQLLQRKRQKSRQSPYSRQRA